MKMEWCCQKINAIRIVIHVQPNAKRTELAGIFDGALKIRLQAQPVDGKANDALIAYLAGKLCVPKSRIEITHGHTNKRKIILIHQEALTVEDIKRTLAIC